MKKLTLDSESPEEFYSEEISTETPEIGEIEEQPETVDYSKNDVEYSEDELEDESEIDEHQGKKHFQIFFIKVQ